MPTFAYVVTRVIERLISRMSTRLLLLAALTIAPALTLATVVGIEQRRPAPEYGLTDAVLLVLAAGLGVAIAWIGVNLLVRRMVRALAQDATSAHEERERR